MNLVAKIYLFEITDAYNCFRKTSATNVLCLGKIKKTEGEEKYRKHILRILLSKLEYGHLFF